MIGLLFSWPFAAPRDRCGASPPMIGLIPLYASGVVEAGGEVTHTLGEGRHAWVQVLRGRIELDGETLAAGDGAARRKSPDSVGVWTTVSDASGTAQADRRVTANAAHGNKEAFIVTPQRFAGAV